MYLLLDEYKRVKEIIPDIDNKFPGLNISRRYPISFIDKLIRVSDDTEVGIGYKFNIDTKEWEYVDPPIESTKGDTPKSNEERILELESQITELQLALVELYESTLMGTEEDGE